MDLQNASARIRPMHLILREGIYYVKLLLRGEETSIALHGINSLAEAKRACQIIFGRLLPSSEQVELDFALAAPG
jgi:hypothetical protein